jgi:hypothetical protein
MLAIRLLCRPIRRHQRSGEVHAGTADQTHVEAHPAREFVQIAQRHVGIRLQTFGVGQIDRARCSFCARKKSGIATAALLTVELEKWAAGVHGGSESTAVEDG